jgi:hypothetical protein
MGPRCRLRSIEKGDGFIFAWYSTPRVVGRTGGHKRQFTHYRALCDLLLLAASPQLLAGARHGTGLQVAHRPLSDSCATREPGTRAKRAFNMPSRSAASGAEQGNSESLRSSCRVLRDRRSPSARNSRRFRSDGARITARETRDALRDSRLCKSMATQEGTCATVCATPSRRAQGLRDRIRWRQLSTTVVVVQLHVVYSANIARSLGANGAMWTTRGPAPRVAG